jgi:hypothetical protein
MTRTLFLTILAIANAITACRTSENDVGSQASDSSRNAPAANVDCKAVEPISSLKDVTGQDSFELSTQCIFNRANHEVRVRILGETFQKVLDDGCNNRDTGYGHVIELNFDGHRIQNVGIKVRGNTSKCNPKRQFKFKFDSKEQFSVRMGRIESKKFPENKDRRFFGLAGYSVRASANDPSMIREKLSSRIFAKISDLAPTSPRGALVYQMSFTKLFVSFGRTQREGPEGSFSRLLDGYYYDYKGLYALAENIDEVFLQSRFQERGQKLKDFTLVQADLARAYFERKKYRRDGWSLSLVGGHEPEDEIDLKAGDETLLTFFDKLNSAVTDDDLAAFISIDSIVNYTAGAIVTGHWDSLLANRNNDFILFDPKEKKWKVVAWDLDNSLGALHDSYESLMTNDIFRPAERNPSRLFEIVFSDKHPSFRQMLKDRLKDILDGAYSKSEFEDTVDRLQGTINQNAESWEGATRQDFEDLKEFANSRRSKIAPQL